MKTNAALSLIVLIFNLTNYLSDAKVVVFFPVPGTSHIRYHTNIARALADLGHETWVCIPESLAKTRQIDTSGIRVLRYGQSLGDIEEKIKKTTRIHEAFFANETYGMSAILLNVLSIFNELAMRILAEGLTEKVKDLKPDLFVLDGLPFVKVIYTIPYKLDIPYAVIGSAHDTLSYRIPFSPAATPFQIIDVNDNMDFPSRLKNAVAYFVMLMRPKLMDPDPVSVFAPEKPHKTLEDIMANAEIFIVEMDPILDYPRPSLPNTKLIGGTAIKEARELKDPFKTFIEHSNRGVILVTFGSTLSNIPDYIFHKINTGCKATGMNIVWRSDEPSPDPARILTQGWVPQNDILGNKNTKLFISHCGKNGQYEALYHGVPILCLPIFGDQPYNAERVRTKGYGLKADMRFISVEDLSDMVRELVTNRTYKDNIARASKLFRLLYQSPKKEAAFWLDHVIEFGGAYMRSASQKMPYYQFLMLDVFAFLSAVISLILVLSCALMYHLYKCIFCKSERRKIKSE